MGNKINDSVEEGLSDNSGNFDLQGSANKIAASIEQQVAGLAKDLGKSFGKAVTKSGGQSR